MTSDTWEDKLQTKISKLEPLEVSHYCGVSYDDEDGMIWHYMNSALAFICSYTGLTKEEVDEHSDLVPVFLTLVNEMYTNRDYTVEQAAENKFVKQILAMHSRNYL